MYTKPRGTRDIIGNESELFNRVVNKLGWVCRRFGYISIETPIFENSELFIRSIGQTSDIVQKEFYSFTDRSDRNLVLRPEGTAGVIRSVVEEKILYNSPTPLKLYYSGPMFRYERPQSGRYRQFHQFGIETIGVKAYTNDLEIITLICQMIKELNLSFKNLRLRYNFIGSFEQRAKWIDMLKEYFAKYQDQLTPISQDRLKINPLRILDDKEDGAKPFVKKAPSLVSILANGFPKDFLQFQKELENVCKTFGLDLVFDQTLVRGLDYYTNFVFELESNDIKFADQKTIVGGGRYERLVAELGGPEIACIGFAIGLERFINEIKSQFPNVIDYITKTFINNQPIKSVVIADLVKDDNTAIQKLLLTLLDHQDRHRYKFFVNYDLVKLDQYLKFANKLNANYILIIGDKEKKDNTITIKNLDSREQINIKNDKNFIDSLFEFLNR